MQEKRVVIALGIMLMLASTTSAYAYSVLHTSSGAELRWYTAQVPYYINVTGFNDFDPDEAIEVIQESFATWEGAGIGIHFEYMGLTDVRSANDDGISVVYFIQDSDEWKTTFPNQQSALGVTRSWAAASGELLGFDLALNDAAVDFTNANTQEDTITDLANTVTHEIGHVMGLDHTDVEEAVMYPTSKQGELSKRTLHQDDIDGIHYLYRDGFEPGLDEEGGLSCSTGPGRDSGEAQGDGALLLLAAFTLFHRRTRRS